MKQIITKDGSPVFVDDEDYEWLNKYTWRRNKVGYAFRGSSKNRVTFKRYMHREIMGAKKNQQVDHINGNISHNQKENLRFSTQSQNRINSVKMKGCLSDYKYVRPDKKRGNYTVRLGKRRKESYIGSFENEHYAALVADLWAVDLYGKFAKTNFPVVSHTKRRMGADSV